MILERLDCSQVTIPHFCECLQHFTCLWSPIFESWGHLHSLFPIFFRLSTSSTCVTSFFTFYLPFCSLVLNVHSSVVRICHCSPHLLRLNCLVYLVVTEFHTLLLFQGSPYAFYLYMFRFKHRVAPNVLEHYVEGFSGR